MPTESSARFVADAILWSRDERDVYATQLLRSRHSGVPHDVAAAYIVVGARESGVLAAIAGQRLALPAHERDAVIAFSRGLDRVRAAKRSGESDDALAITVRETFSLVDVPVTDRAMPSFEDEVLQLAQPVDAESTRGVRAPQPRFSASALNAFQECRRKWFYRYVCGAVEDKGSSASFYGTAFHLALEWFHEEYVRPSPADEARMRAQIPGYIDRAFAEHRADFETEVEFTLQLRRARRTAQRYVTWLVERARRMPFTVVGRELPAALEVEGFDFIGYIDRLDRNESGTVSVIDYKTGSIAASAAEYRDKVRTFRDFQLPFYYWAREAQGDRVATLALIPLKDAMLDVRPIELEVVPIAREERKRSDAAFGTIPLIDLERARQKIGEICSELTSGNLARFEPASDPSACTYCAYTNACNDRPAPEENKFGR